MQLFLHLALATFVVAQSEPLAAITPPKGTQATNLPALGLGTWYAKGSNATAAVAQAIVDGYRLIDTSPFYNNQKEVGAGVREGIKRAGISRQDVWVTSKLWTTKHSDPNGGLKETLAELGLDYVDLWLIHWPMGPGNTFDHVPTWQKMEKLPATKMTRYIGISNFSPAQVKDVLKVATIKPKVMQIELHPYLPQEDFVASLQKQGITVNAYAPLGNTNPAYKSSATKLLQHSTIRSIASARGCTPAQVVLAWNMKRSVVVIPKAVQIAHQKENIATPACAAKLTAEDLEKIAQISNPPHRFMSSPCASNQFKCFEGTTKGF
ncbi:Aldo/keto reductase [Microthyrium microscopicum]|uniref:Aldo/keto reductase n=1 Tax=Microthyrium microscopicum TaxID=703497 RepID=A0A6A6UNG2_9PEZI|nr:Aldo/keto reductase [Microthyrium microscopicum]